MDAMLQPKNSREYRKQRSTVMMQIYQQKRAHLPLLKPLPLLHKNLTQISPPTHPGHRSWKVVVLRRLQRQDLSHLRLAHFPKPKNIPLLLQRPIHLPRTDLPVHQRQPRILHSAYYPPQYHNGFLQRARQLQSRIIW